MKICLLYCGSVTASWSLGDGLANALQKAGHQVLRIARGRLHCPLVTVQALNLADAIIVSGPEHILRAHVKGGGPNGYNFTDNELTIYDWKHEVKPPKIFLYHESNHREDQTFGFEDYLTYGDYHFFPAVQDAETYDQEHFAKGRSFWLPFGVDTDVFKRIACAVCRNGVTRIGCKVCLGVGTQPNQKDIDVGFVGMMYPKRNQFISNLSQHMKQGRDPWVVIGNVQVQDMDGPAGAGQAKRLAMNYRRCKGFLNMPAYSELLVTKVLEVMACGTFLLTPMLAGSAEANCSVFQHAKDLAYYNTTNLPFIVQTMREFVERDELRERIALTGMSKVIEKHSLKVQIPQILEKAQVAQKAVIQ